MIGDDQKGAKLRANRLELRVDKLEDKLSKRHDELDKLREEVRVKEDRIRYLKQALARIDDDLAELSAARDRLQKRNLSVPWLPDHESEDARPDARLDAIRATLEAIHEAADRLETLVDGDELAEPTDATDVLQAHIRESTVAERAASQAPSVAQLYRMWVDADTMDRYRRELLEPYARAACHLLEDDPDETTVHAAKAALAMLKDAFNESRTFLLRRSPALDDHVVDVDVHPQRWEQDPKLALQRFDAVLEQARAIGAVDFFHNLRVRVQDGLDSDEDGAAPAAWLLADVTASILGDDAVKSWIEDGMS